MIAWRLEKILRKIMCSMLLRTNVGIKSLNKLVQSESLMLDLVKNIDDLSIDQMFSFADFLKDAHTLLGWPIQAWPHYDLIKCLDQERRLEDGDYVKRCLSGTLDFRNRMKISPEFLEAKYQEQIQRMESGETFQIKVCHAYDHQYVVTDGHHTLAMASYFNYPNVQFVRTPNLIFDSYYLWIFKLIKNDSSYDLHNQFINKAYAFHKPSMDKDTLPAALA